MYKKLWVFLLVLFCVVNSSSAQLAKSVLDSSQLLEASTNHLAVCFATSDSECVYQTFTVLNVEWLEYGQTHSKECGSKFFSDNADIIVNTVELLLEKVKTIPKKMWLTISIIFDPVTISPDICLDTSESIQRNYTKFLDAVDYVLGSR